MKQKGFTLIELLVVISIVGLLSSVVMASLNSAREKGRLAAGRQFDANIYHATGDQAMGVWNFDDGTGLVAADISGSGNNGALNGGAAFFADSPSSKGGSVQFDGVNDYVKVIRNTSIEPSSALTMSAWIKPTAAANNNNYNILFKLNWGTKLGYRLFLGGYTPCVQKNCLGVSIGDGTNRPEPTFVSSELANTGRWYHVAGVFNGTSVSLYIDGRLVQNTSVAVTSIVNDTVQDLLIGAANGSEYFPGFIDEPKIYSKSLTASEISEIYARGLKKHSLATSVVK